MIGESVFLLTFAAHDSSSPGRESLELVGGDKSTGQNILPARTEADYRRGPQRQVADLDSTLFGLSRSQQAAAGCPDAPDRNARRVARHHDDSAAASGG